MITYEGLRHVCFVHIIARRNWNNIDRSKNGELDVMDEVSDGYVYADVKTV